MDPLTTEVSPEPQPEHGLWLSKRLIDQWRSTASLGIILMVVCYLFALSSILYTLMRLWLWIGFMPGDFYLMEGDNLKKAYGVVASVTLVILFARGTKDGYQAWKFLRNSEQSDDDMLDGTEKLGKWFRWLALWGALFVATILIDIWVYDLFSILVGQS